MFMMFAPVHSVLAALVATETVIGSARGQEARDLIHQVLAREDVQAALSEHGIDPSEAKARIDSLTDEEVIRIADQIDQLPEGAGAAGFLIIVLLVLVIVLVVLDVTGVADIFTFIK
jgi:hypothetical protein